MLGDEYFDYPKPGDLHTTSAMGGRPAPRYLEVHPLGAEPYVLTVDKAELIDGSWRLTLGGQGELPDGERPARLYHGALDAA